MREPIIRLTVLQPDPIVHVERFGGWLAQNRAMLTSVPLAQRPAPAVADVGDGVLILGGRMNVHDATQPWLPGVKRLIVEAVARDVPVLGICLGHQLIADALGGNSGWAATRGLRGGFGGGVVALCATPGHHRQRELTTHSAN